MRPAAVPIMMTMGAPAAKSDCLYLVRKRKEIGGEPLEGETV